MKTIEQWFDEYAQSHQHPTNKLIHWVCVPTIYFSILGIIAHFSVLLTALMICCVLVFYTRLDLLLAIAMAILSVVMIWLICTLPMSVGFYLALFVCAWIGQFYGHRVEGKKPSFFKDLQFLLIGPLWCVDSYLTKLLPQWKTRQKSLLYLA